MQAYPHKGDPLYAGAAGGAASPAGGSAAAAGATAAAGGFRASPKPLVPHGISVVMSAPAVFAFTAAANPARHAHAARILAGDASAPAMPPSERRGGSIGSGKGEPSAADAGAMLAEQLRRYMDIMRVPDGLTALGFADKDVPDLVASTLPQKRVLDLSPAVSGREELTSLFQACMKVY